MSTYFFYRHIPQGYNPRLPVLSAVRCGCLWSVWRCGLCRLFAQGDIWGVVMVFFAPVHSADRCSRFTTLTPFHFHFTPSNRCVSSISGHVLSSEGILVKRFAPLLFRNGSMSKKEKRLTMHHAPWYPCRKISCLFCLLICLERTDFYDII